MRLSNQVAFLTLCCFTSAQTCLDAYTTADTVYLGCFTDPVTPRTLSGEELNPGSSNTPQYCAYLCGDAGFEYAGVEYSVQCFCGNSIRSSSILSAESSCDYPCPGNTSVSCGGFDFINIYQITNPNPDPVEAFLPDCSRNPLCSNDVCDSSLDIQTRAAALVNAMTLDEKVANVVNGAAGSQRLGLPPYQWWSEALHGVASSPGVIFQSAGTNFSYATSFPMPILTAAAFDDPLVNSIGTTVGREARAFANSGNAGFDFWTPNINPFRDPRWGRGMETPGEDPYHIQNYVYNLVTGLQGGLDPAVKQVISTCKHFAAYDIETTRYSNDLDPTQQDMAEYYLPPFKTCTRDAKGGSVMCSYNAVDGIPSCASEYLLQRVLREEWNFSAPYNWITSDCDAIEDVYSSHHYVSTAAEAAAVSLNAGTDLNCGTTYLSLNESVLYNLTTETALDTSLTRLFSSLIQVGWFNQAEPYNFLSWADVGTPAAETLAYQAAIEGCTLLKNDGILPLLNSTSNVALIGPWADATTQMQGNYYGIAPFLITPLSAFQKHWPDTTYAIGTSINTTSTDGFASALAVASSSDYIIYIGGIDTTIEAESMDRPSIVWPGNQLDLISQLASIGKPLIVVQCGGGQLDDSTLLENANVSAILWAGYPGQDGGNAIFDIINGDASVAGRLPVTQYPAAFTDEVTMFEMNLRPSSGYPGRTYKWYNGTPVIPFGYGLHYADFSLSWGSTPQSSYSIEDLVDNSSGTYTALSPFFTVTVQVQNTGGRANLASDYVGLLFISTTNAGPAPYPIKQLVSYSRLHGVSVGSTQELTLPLTLGSLARADSSGDFYLYPGDYQLTVDIDSNITFEFELTGTATLIESLPTNLVDVTAFEYLGCYASSTSLISGTVINLGSSNYPQLCVDECAQAGYYYSGVQEDNCLCGKVFPNTIAPSSETNCNSPCSGDPSEMCGSSAYLNIYNSTLPTTLQSATT